MKNIVYLTLFCFFSSAVHLPAITISTIGSWPEPSDRIALKVQGHTAEVQFESSSDQQYSIEFSADLQHWSLVENEIFGTGAMITRTNDPGSVPMGFYRVRRSDEFTFTVNPACFHVGSRWTYRITEADLFENTTATRIQVEYIKTVNPQNGYDVVGLRKETESGALVEVEYILNDFSNGIFLVGIKDAKGQKSYFDPLEAVDCNRFFPGVQSDPVTVVPPDPSFSNTKVMTTVMVAYGTVTVPAGSFNDTVLVDQVMTGTYSEDGQSADFTWDTATWYSKEAGNVKSVSTLSFDGYGALMTETSELTAYSLQ